MKIVSTEKNQTVRHLGIIMDGNGRWAKKHFLPRIEGHRQGAKAVKSIMEAAFSNAVEYLTLYTFSVENWNRPQSEINGLMKLMLRMIDEHKKSFLEKKIRFRTIGRIKELPKEVYEAIIDLQELTKDFTKYNLVLAINYGARTELLDAVEQYHKDNPVADSLTWDQFSQYLYTKDMPDPDLIIRTSGEKRLSNFLLMQAAYSEIYYTDVLWPDFNNEHLMEAFDDYNKRRRRFGKTDEQIENSKD